MRSLLFLLTFLISMPECVSFGLSEEQRFAIELKQAATRKQDFERRLEKQRQFDEQREGAAMVIKERRARYEQRLELARKDFVRRRNERPRVDEEKIESILESKRRKEEEALEKMREVYVQKRERREATLAKEAKIDETIEYDLIYREDEIIKTQQ